MRPDIERSALLGHVSFAVSDTLEFFAEVDASSSDSVSDPANGALGPFVGAHRARQRFLVAGRAGRWRRAAASSAAITCRICFPPAIRRRTTRFASSPVSRATSARSGAGTPTTNTARTKTISACFTTWSARSCRFRRVYNFLGFAMDAVVDPANPNNIVCRATIPGAVLQPARGGLRAAEPVRRRSPQSGCDRLRLSHAQGGHRVRPERRRRQFPLRPRRGLGGPDQRRLRRRVATGRVSGDARYGESALVRRLSSGLGPRSRRQDRGAWKSMARCRCRSPNVSRPTSPCGQPRTMPRARPRRASARARASRAGRSPAIYDPLDWLRFRATRSQDIRAGNFRELFLPRNTVQAAPGGFPGPITNPWNGNIPESYLSITGGNPALSPKRPTRRPSARCSRSTASGSRRTGSRSTWPMRSRRAVSAASARRISSTPATGGGAAGLRLRGGRGHDRHHVRRSRLDQHRPVSDPRCGSRGGL